MKLDSSLSGLCVSKVSAKMKNDDFQIFGALTRDHTYEVRTHANAGRCINENEYAKMPTCTSYVHTDPYR